jgi:hypothetical protein
MNYPQFKFNDNQVIIEKLPNQKGRIVRQSVTYELSFNDVHIKQSCMVCDKILLELKPQNGTKIRIKCRGVML